jgi:hypothetical protein
MLETIERKLRPYAVPNVALYLVMGQVFVYITSVFRPELLSQIVYVPALVARGEIWRLATFLFIPPATNPFFLFFALYIFLMMGSALEGHWGAVRFNLFLAVGYAASLASASVAPDGAATNAWLYGSVFLAFAFLYPNFELHLFFLIPVKVKWLALITWIGYGWGFATGTWMTRALILASVGNVLLFFGRDILRKARYGARQMQAQAQQVVEEAQPFHLCRVCGATDRDDRTTEFRYCSQCAGSPCYCEKHIFDHEHVQEEEGEVTAG